MAKFGALYGRTAIQGGEPSALSLGRDPTHSSKSRFAQHPGWIIDIMINIGFALAAAAAAAGFAVHTFVGGVFVARPLLRDKALPRASRLLNYYCWHVTTVLIVYMALAFGAAAFSDAARTTAGYMAVIAATASLLSAAVAIQGGVAPWRFPSTTLFASAAGFAGWGWFL